VHEGFVIRFRGVRGTHPAPGATTLKYGGNTACVEVWAGGSPIILDAGTGIVPLGRDLMRWHKKTAVPIVASLFLSHTHPDHTQGFPFFSPAHEGSSTLYIFGPKTFDQDMADAMSRAMLPPTFPVLLEELPSLKIISNISHNQVILIGPDHRPHIRNAFRQSVEAAPDTVRVSILQSFFHPSGSVNVFKIEWNGKSLVYATDIEGVAGGDVRLIRFCRGCDVLIHDAQYTAEEYLQVPMQGWGHSTPEMATLVAQRAQVKQLVLFHHDPRHDDATLDAMLVQAQALFPETRMAYEGLTLRL
jgi:phosphoribosyl 1,2-cyclic phosphodiesterase